MGYKTVDSLLTKKKGPMGRKKVHIKPTWRPRHERKRSSTRVRTAHESETFVNQYGCEMAYSPKHKTYVPTGRVL